MASRLLPSLQIRKEGSGFADSFTTPAEGLRTELHLNIAFGGPAVIVDDADEMYAFCGGPPGECALAHRYFADQRAAVEPEHIADVCCDAGFQCDDFLRERAAQPAASRAPWLRLRGPRRS